MAPIRGKTLETMEEILAVSTPMVLEDSGETSLGKAQVLMALMRDSSEALDTRKGKQFSKNVSLQGSISMREMARNTGTAN